MKNASNLLSMKNLIKLMGLVLILVLVAQMALTFLPFFELEYKSKGEMVSEEFSLFDQMWWRTERMTSAFSLIPKGKLETLTEQREALEDAEDQNSAEFKQAMETLRQDIAALMEEINLEQTPVSTVKADTVKQDLKNMKTDLKSIKDDLKVYNINEYVVPLALTFALGLVIILTTLLSWRCLATHVVAIAYIVVSIPAYFANDFFSRGNLPAVDSVVLWSRVLIVVTCVLIVIRTALWIYERYIKAYFKFKKAKAEWEVRLAEAIAAEEAAKAEVAE